MLKFSAWSGPTPGQKYGERPSALDTHSPRADEITEVTASSGWKSDALLFNERTGVQSHLGVWLSKTLERTCGRPISPPRHLRSKIKWLTDSAIRIAYRSSLRSSSVWEPRYPPLKISIFLFCFLVFSPSCLDEVYFGLNDPTADSSTITLLRLLLPLSDKIYGTSSYCKQHKSKQFTGPLKIGRSDGRCVQRAGT